MSKSAEASGFLLNALPGAGDVLLFSMSLTYAEAKCESALQSGVGEVEGAGPVKAIHEGLIGVVAGPEPEADQIEGHWSGEFEARVFAYPLRELLREGDVAADVVLQAFDPVVADYKP